MLEKALSPATALLNRMGYTKKFALQWLASLIAIAVVVYSLFASLDRVIQPSQRELQGLALIEPIPRTIQIIQQHRGISSLLLGGNGTMKGRRAAKERETAEAFKAVEEMLPHDLISSEDFRLIKTDWERLRKEGLHWTVAENFAAHTRLIEQVQLFELSVADEYALTLDPEVNTFYLIDTIVNRLPHALEHLGQIRAYGTGILARKQITERQKAKINALLGEFDSTLNELKTNLDKAGRYNSVVRGSLLAAYGAIADSARKITGLVESDILAGHFATPPDVFLDMATAEIDKGYAQMYEALLPTTKTLIEARIAQAEKTLFITVSTALLLFLMMVYISVSIYYAIIGSIQSLVRSAHTFAGGDLSVRVKLDTRDEISRIGDSFNEMADGFSALLETHREVEARLRTTIESALDAVVQMDDAGIIIGWNSQAEKIFGWTRDEAVGRVLSETILPPQYREAHVQGLERFLLSGEGPVLHSRIEIVGLHRDGHEFPVELAIALVHTAGKHEFSAFIRDITERKQAEQILMQHKKVLDTAIDGFWMVDARGNLLEVNAAYEMISGYSADELKKMHISQLEAKEKSVEEVTAHIEKVIAEGSDRFETRHRHKDGHEIDIEISTIFLPDTQQFAVFARDITERKRLERELHISAAAFEAQEGITITDEEGIIVRVNRTFTTITGYSAEEAIGNTPRVLKSGRHDDEFYRRMWGSLLRNKFWQGEIWNKRKNGEIYPELLTITAVVAEDGKTNNYVAIFLDITERKRAEAEIVAINDELQQANARIEEERALLAARVAERTAQLVYANRAKDSFLAMMSHEIRTPLGGLLGMMELISLSRLDGEQREMLQAARDSGRSLLHIVNDILDWSKIEAGKLELAPQAATIPEMVKGVVSTYSPLASAKGLLLRQRVDSKLGAAHIFDPLRLSQIINNFTSNAIKFTERGAVEISAELVAQHEGAEQMRFCVKDSGVGISPEQQAHLFQNYEQASADTARMYGGTGLGLAICHSLAELMGGTISVESIPGHGSTFCITVSLPLASPVVQRDVLLRQAREDSSNGIPDIIPLVKDGKPATVLVVDDHPVNRVLLKRQLEQLGLHAEEAAYGIVALSLWRTGRFDMIITDCHMPEMNGYELTRSIREMEQHDGRQHVPIIAWTANVLAEEEERCRAAGMDDMLTKPTGLADLRAMLLKWLAKTGVSLNEAQPPEIVSIEAAQNQVPAGAPIDFSVLKKIAASNAAQAEMLQEFNFHNRSDIACLKAALKDGDPAAVERSAHRIKGASRMVGALELAGICAAIEKAAAQGDLSGARILAGTALDEAIERIEAAISAFIAMQ